MTALHEGSDRLDLPPGQLQGGRHADPLGGGDRSGSGGRSLGPADHDRLDATGPSSATSPGPTDGRGAGRAPSRVGVLITGYLALFAAWGVVRSDQRVIAYLAVGAVVIVALRRAHRATPFSPRLCAALAVCGLLHMGGGILPSPSPGAGVFYETWLIPGLLKFDQLVHFTTSGVVTVAIWQVCDRWCDPRRCSPSAQAVLSVLAALGLGGLNEAFEFLSALRFPNYVGGLANTGWDLVFNFFGAATFGVFLACSALRPTPPGDTEHEG